MAKPNVKELVVNHFEKGIFAVACLLALITLAGTRWAPYKGHPNEITKKVTDADRKIADKTWPQDEQESFVVPQGESVEELVARNVHKKIDSAAYEFDMPFIWDIHGTTDPIEEPDYLGIRALLAHSGRFLMAIQPEVPLEESDEDGKLMADASEEEEDDQANIPEEFRTRDTLSPATGAGAGALGAEFGSEYANPGAAGMSQYLGQMEAMGGGGYGEEDYGSYGGYGMMGGMYGEMGGGPTVEGRGLRYVSVRGIIPLREQVRKLMKAINLRSFSQASSLYEIIDFQLERKKLQPGDDPWAGEWEPVNVDIALDILNESLSFDPEVVQTTITDSAVTMPLPGRVMGVWQSMATHPMLDDFTLSQEEIDKEVAFNRILLDKHLEEKQNVPEERVEKRGFAGIQYSGRAMQMDMMGYGAGSMEDYDYSESYGDSDYGSEGMAMSTGYGMGGINYAPTSQASMTHEAQEFIDKLTRGELGQSKEEQDKALLEYIKERITAQGELLLFRYLDFDVEPGATYKYRARLEVRNPNYGLPIAQVGGVAHIVEGQTRFSDWSNETEPVMVPHDVDYFVARIEEKSSGLAEARMSLFQWNPDYGTTIHDSVEVTYGQEVGGPKETFILDPAKNRFEAEQYTFHTGDVLVDVLAEDKIPGNELREGGLHADLVLPRSARGELGISGQALISKGNEQLAVIDHYSRIAALEKRREYLQYEQQPYEDIKNKEGRKPAMNDLEAYGEYGEYGAMMSGEFDSDDYGSMGGYGAGPSGGYGGGQGEDYGRGRRGGSGMRKRGRR